MKTFLIGVWKANVMTNRSLGDSIKLLGYVEANNEMAIVEKLQVTKVHHLGQYEYHYRKPNVKVIIQEIDKLASLNEALDKVIETLGQ